ncbi:MAG: MotA/TolQ/ExbB proton channel family protein [Candidatus Makaraimicrobium thalassicum]|nr:MAG: MotA/TolQ/ExbB proton channel family protein [Candidatus Omnitrophota bacterium]
MFIFFLKGGLLMWPIAFCSVMVAAISMERLYHFRRAKVNVPGLLTRVRKLLSEGDIHEAEKLCRESSGPVARLLAVGLHIHPRSAREQERILARVGSRELRRLGKNLRNLGIIAHISPLLGLLGTVTGLIRAFIKIQELHGQVDAAVLAGGIWEALLTTAAGMSVAIPTIIAYHYFEGRVDDFSSQMKDAVQYLFEWMGVEKSASEQKDMKSKEDVEYGL